MSDEEIDHIVDQFFDQVSADAVEDAVDNVFAKSELATRIAEKQTLAVRIRNITTLNGELRYQELISSSSFGSLVVRRTYLAQYVKAVIRWDFVCVKLPTGWSTVHLGFSEAAQDWI